MRSASSPASAILIFMNQPSPTGDELTRAGLSFSRSRLARGEAAKKGGSRKTQSKRKTRTG
jgi:hypothetical protein